MTKNNKEKKCTITFSGNSQPWEKYAQLKEALKEAIEDIDRLTPWQDHEPKWWLEMSNIDRIARGLNPID